jgi:hypothetical protein
MLCYAVLCYAMLCYALLCYAMLCYAMLCYAMLCYAMLCYAVLCEIVLFRTLANSEVDHNKSIGKQYKPGSYSDWLSPNRDSCSLVALSHLDSDALQNKLKAGHAQCSATLAVMLLSALIHGGWVTAAQCRRLAEELRWPPIDRSRHSKQRVHAGERNMVTLHWMALALIEHSFLSCVTDRTITVIDVIEAQDFRSYRLLPGRSNSICCCIRILHAFNTDC